VFSSRRLRPSILIGCGIQLLLAGCASSSAGLYDFDEDGFQDQDDCDPADPSVYPGAPDPYGDGIDQDCDTLDGVDHDGDGYPAPGEGVPPDLEDCNDADDTIHPGADDPIDGTDQDCDGFSRPVEVTLTPLEPRTGDNLELRVTTDAVIYDISWSVNEQPRTEFSGFETITSAQTTKGDLWAAEVIAYADGGGASEPQTASVTILNSPPVASLIVGLDPDPREGDTVSAAATVVDDDGDTAPISYAWLVNGVQVNAESVEQLTSEDFDKGDEIWAELTPDDGLAAGVTLETNHVFAINTPPIAVNAGLDPPSGGESSVFTCLVSGWTDPDPADTEGYDVQWYVNEGPSVTTASLDGTSFDRGDTLRCEATPNDGEETGATLASSVVTVANTLPTLASVAIDPSAGDETTTFACQPSGWLDPDPSDATPVYSFQWYVGAPGSEVATITDATIDGSAFDHGDSIYCEVWPLNEIDPSLPPEAGAPVVSSAVVVANSLPQITSASIEPAGATTSDTLSVLPVGWSDIDGDPAGYLYQWWIEDAGGTVIDGGTAATLEPSATLRDDSITVDVTPNDGLDSGVQLLAGPITIANTLPTAPVVAISPTEPSPADALSCSISAAAQDPDADAGTESLSYDISWFADVTHEPTYDVLGADASGTSVVPANATEADDVWTCEVTPFDSVGPGVIGSASVGPIAASCSPGDGTESQCAAESCASVISDGSPSVDGLYWIDPDDSGVLPPTQLYCGLTSSNAWGLLANYIDSAQDDIPNTASFLVDGWQQTGDGLWTSPASIVDNSDVAGSSAAVSLEFVEALTTATSALMMCFVDSSGDDTNCRSSDDGSLTLTATATGNSDLTPYSSDPLTYTYGRLAGLFGSGQGYYSSPAETVAYQSFCIPRSPGVGADNWGSQSFGLCEHDGAWGCPGCRGPWHGFGGGAAFNPAGTTTDEVRTDTGGIPSTIGFRLYLLEPPAPPGCSSLAVDDTNAALTSSFIIPSGGYTVEAWVWLNDVGPQPILSSSNMNLGVYGGNDGLVVQYPGHSDLTATNEAVPINQWTHLVWAYSGSGGMQAANWDFYIDGVLSTGEVHQGAAEPPLSGNSVELGSFTAHNCCLVDLDGQMRSIRISSGLRYTTGFTPDAELDSDSTTLVLWDFDGADSGVIADLSGNGYEVTPSSNVSWSPTCPEQDGDGDGVAVWQDCDDSNGSVYPYAGDTYGDGLDEDCDGLDCDAGRYEDAYFQLCDSRLSWSDAQAECQSRGYEGLVSITSAAEEGYLQALPSSAYYSWAASGFGLGARIWSGLQTLSWASGLPVNYLNWNPSEPSGDGACVEMNTVHGWNDVNCNQAMPFFCEDRALP